MNKLLGEAWGAFDANQDVLDSAFREAFDEGGLTKATAARIRNARKIVLAAGVTIALIESLGGSGSTES